MLAERMTQWRQEALDEGRRQGLSEGRKQGISEGWRRGVSEGRRQGVSHELQRLAAHRFGVAAGDAMARLLANVKNVERLAKVGDLVVDCASAEELKLGLLNNMTERTMWAEVITQLRQGAVDEGRRRGLSEGRSQGIFEGWRQGMSEGRRQGVSHELQRLAVRRFGVATGDALAGLLANEEDVDRLADVGDLVVDCATAEELLRRAKGVLNGGR